MTLDEFRATKNLFDQGQIRIQDRRRILCFLFDGRWYPVRQFVSSIHPGANTYNSISLLASLFPYLRFKEVNVIGANSLPIPLTIMETMDETRLFLERLNELHFR